MSKKIEGPNQRSVRIDTDQYEQLRQLSKTGMPIAVMVRRSIACFLMTKEEKKLDTRLNKQCHREGRASWVDLEQ